MLLVRKLTLVLTSFLVLLATVITIPLKVHAAGAWETYGQTPISTNTPYYTGLKFTKNGTPYIAYIDTGTNDLDINDDTLVVKRFNGTVWEELGGGPVPNAKPGSLDMVLSPGNIPYVVYTDYDHSNKLTAQRFNGSSWEVLGSTGFSLTIADGHSIALDSNDKLYVAYAMMTGGGEKPVVQHFNGSSWDVVGPAGLSSEEPSTLVQMAVTSTDVPYIVYQDYADYNTKLVAKRFNGSDWEVVGTPGFSAGHALAESMVMSSDNVPYVSFFDNGNSNHTSVMRFNGTDWEAVGAPGFTTGTTFNSRLSFTSHDTLYIVYNDSSNANKAEVRRFNGTAWELVGPAGFTPGTGAFSSIAIDARDIPYVLYADENQGYKLTLQRFIDGTDQLSDPATTALNNSETGKPVKVTSGFGTTLTCSSSSKESSLAKQDTGYDYPNGLTTFCFNNDFTNNQVSLIFVTDLQPSQMVVRKYNSTTGLYAVVPGATVAQTTYNGQAALQVSYSIADNGPFDENPITGAIKDPVGIATPTNTLANTGDSLTPIYLMSVGLLGIGLAMFIHIFRTNKQF
jgi:hypothetical protein